MNNIDNTTGRANWHNLIKAEDIAGLLDARIGDGTGKGYLRGFSLHYTAEDDGTEQYIGEVGDEESVIEALDEWWQNRG